MKAFKDYVIEEYKGTAENYVAVEFRFSHTVSERVNKGKVEGETMKVVKVDSIKVTIRFYDKDMQLLSSRMLTFENNEVPKSISKKLINISPDELANKFMSAKGEICNVILNEYKNKREECSNKMTCLLEYVNTSGNKNDVTPQEFKGESIQVVETPKEAKPKNKKVKKFDM